jgi:allantoinase
VADVYPSLAAAVVDAGWELVGHSWFQRSLKQSEDEAAEIKQCLDRLEQLDGKRPRAWLGAGMGETFETPDILRENGVMFLHDWLLDDLPCWMQTRHGPMVAMPYTFELNDVVNHVVQQSTTDEMLRRLQATLAIFEREIAEEGQPRIITLGLHPHIIGVPHIAYHFEKALDLLMARRDVVFMTSSGIGDWFVAADGTNGAGLPPFRD